MSLRTEQVVYSHCGQVEGRELEIADARIDPFGVEPSGEQLVVSIVSTTSIGDVYYTSSCTKSSPKFFVGIVGASEIVSECTGTGPAYT